MTPATLTPTRTPSVFSRVISALTTAMVALLSWVPADTLRRLRPSRRSTRLLVTLGIVGGALVLGGLATAPQAVAGPCDSNQTLPSVVGVPAPKPGVSSAMVVKHGRFTAVEPVANEYLTYPDPAAGLDFHSFGFSPCSDLASSAELSTVSFLWQSLVLLPLKLVGTALDLTLGGKLGAMVLGLMAPLAKRLHENVFSTWAPLVITLALIPTIIGVARGRQKAWGQIAWMTIVVAFAGAIATPQGVALATKANAAIAGATKCATMSIVSEAPCDQGTLGDELIEQLAVDAWGQGVLGNIATDPAPASFSFTTGVSDVPAISDSWSIEVPRGSIPARIPGQPTYAEVWRWTEAYTSPELTSLKGTGADTRRCSIAGASPHVKAISDQETDDLKFGELCSYKWTVRAAMLSDIATNHPELYPQVRGVAHGATWATLTGLVLVPLVVALTVIAADALIAEVMFAVWLTLTSIAALFALRSPEPARNFAGKVVATAWRRFLTGVALGFAILLLVTVKGMVDGVDGAVTTLTVTPAARPLAMGFLGLIAMIVAWQVKDQLMEFSQGAGMSTDVPGGNSVAAFARRGLAMGVGAGFGGLAAGKGARAAGARRGLAAGLTGDPGQAMTRGTTAGWTEGVRQDAREERAAATADRAAAATGLADERAASQTRDATEAANEGWQRVRADVRPPSAAATQRQIAEVEGEIDRAGAELEARRDRRPADVAALGAALRRERPGMTAEAAAAEAGRQWEEGTEALGERLSAAQERLAGLQDQAAEEDEAWQATLAEIVADLDAGHDPSDVALRRGLSDHGAEALRAYVTAQQEAARLTYARH